MDKFLEITLDIRQHYGISVDVYVNEEIRVNELVYETLSGLNLALTSIDNIVLRIERSGVALMQSEQLKDGGVRNGDVLSLI